MLLASVVAVVSTRFARSIRSMHALSSIFFVMRTFSFALALDVRAGSIAPTMLLPVGRTVVGLMVSSKNSLLAMSLIESLSGLSIDVLAPLRTSWYNDYIKSLGLSTDSTKYLERSGEQHASGEAAPFALSPLPDFGRGGDALAFLVGNSKAMWPCFLRWLRQQPDPALKDPIDTYSAEVIGRVRAVPPR